VSFRKAEERTENRHPRANGAACKLPLATLLRQQIIYLDDVQRLEAETGLLELQEKLIKHPTVNRDRVGG
jgi:hypothetical protein